MLLTLTDSFKDITEKDIVNLEKHLGLTLPPAYRSFLLEHNGGEPTPASFTTQDGEHGSRVRFFYGIATSKYYSLKTNTKVFSDRLPAGYIAIASDDAGNLVVLNSKPGSPGDVLFFDHETEDLAPIADTFDSFIEGLHESDEEPASAFDQAIDTEDLSYFRQRIASGGIASIVDEFDRPAILVAALWGKLNVLKFLAGEGASLEGTLFAAAGNGQIDIVQYLLANGANVDERGDDNNNTPLLAAAHDGHLDLVKLLIDAGADIKAVNDFDQTLQDKARFSDNRELIKFVKSLK
jgi:cell wall assembly regulator SMI1